MADHHCTLPALLRPGAQRSLSSLPNETFQTSPEGLSSRLPPKIVMAWEDFECGTCGKIFPAGWRARDNHCRATGHQPPDFECDTCSRWFESRRACIQHMNDKNHFAYECNICNETWPTEEDRTVHENEEHCYCADCDRLFSSYNGIKMVSANFSFRLWVGLSSNKA